jgi:hypothetical protein
MRRPHHDRAHEKHGGGKVCSGVSQWQFTLECEMKLTVIFERYSGMTLKLIVNFDKFANSTLKLP